MLEAKLKACNEYEKFRVIQDQTYESDFDREVKTLKPCSGIKNMKGSENRGLKSNLDLAVLQLSMLSTNTHKKAQFC